MAFCEGEKSRWRSNTVPLQTAVQELCVIIIFLIHEDSGKRYPRNVIDTVVWTLFS